MVSSMNLGLFIIVYLIILSITLSIIFILYLIFKSPFKYPYFIYNFDVTGKKNPKIENYIDNFLIEQQFSKIYRMSN